MDYTPGDARRPPPFHLSLFSDLSVGMETGALGSGIVNTNWPIGHRAILVPFVLREPVNAQKVFYSCGATAAGVAVDVGVYTYAGVLVFSSGSRAVAAGFQSIDTTDVMLPGGLRYHMALSLNTTSTTITRLQTIPGAILASIGFTQADSSFPLPSTITNVTFTTASFAPLFGVGLRTLA